MVIPFLQENNKMFAAHFHQCFSKFYLIPAANMKQQTIRMYGHQTLMI